MSRDLRRFGDVRQSEKAFAKQKAFREQRQGGGTEGVRGGLEAKCFFGRIDDEREERLGKKGEKIGKTIVNEKKEICKGERGRFMRFGKFPRRFEERKQAIRVEFCRNSTRREIEAEVESSIKSLKRTKWIPDAFPQRVLLTGRFLIFCPVVLVAEAMPTGYSPKIHFRCRASTFRQVCDRLRATFGEELVNALRLLQLDQFLLMPAFKQNVPLVHMLLTKWNVKKQCFVIKGKNIPFTAEEVALITGLLNRGADFVVGNGRTSGVTANDLRHEIDGMKRSTPLKDLLEKFIVYLLSNLFFPLANFRVPSSILPVAENAEEFLKYNWSASIREFLVAEFDSIAAKHRNNTPLGYINGFVIILIIWFLEHTKVVDPVEELSRPRFVRWDSQIMYSEKDVLGVLKEVQV
ncbi:hypothetical protein M5K25_018750 [Dendrobium thyrsiflorum]|uniref:Uncharacterized protein n=1 Tax=Dendrobium thyrsiflorum TaxID=117978 RepID=A0ABD0UD91_DENTH